MKLNVRWAPCRSCIYTIWFKIKNYGLDFTLSYSLLFHLNQGQFTTFLLVWIWKLSEESSGMTVTSSLPYATTKKKLLQAGNHQFSASKRGRSNAFKLQQGGWISAKCFVGKDTELGYLGSLWHLQLGSSPGQGMEHPKISWATVVPWSSATIWGKNARYRTETNSIPSLCGDRPFTLFDTWQSRKRENVKSAIN